MIKRKFTSEHKAKLKKAWEKRRLIPESLETREKKRLGALQALKDNPSLILSRRRIGKDNGMYGSKRFGDKNPMYGKKHSEETRKKIAQRAKGRKISEDLRKKLCKIHSERYRDIKERMKSSQPGEKNGNWRGGISKLPYGYDFTQKLKDRIKKRDNYTCQLCKAENEILCIHHIDYDKLNCVEYNLISLCYKCHSKTNFKREDWIDYFVGRMKIYADHQL